MFPHVDYHNSFLTGLLILILQLKYKLETSFPCLKLFAGFLPPSESSQANVFTVVYKTLLQCLPHILLHLWCHLLLSFNHSTNLLSPIYSFTYSIPSTLASWLFSKHIMHAPASGPMYLPFLYLECCSSFTFPHCLLSFFLSLLNYYFLSEAS